MAKHTVKEPTPMEYRVPENVTVVQKSLARDDVERVILHAGVTEIAEDAFRDWDSLKEVVFAKGSRLERIGPHAFARTALREFAAPNTLKEICDGTFMNCKNLKEVRLNEGLESLGEGVFAGSGLEVIYLPFTLQEISDGALLSCKNLKKVLAVEGCKVGMKRCV